VEIGVTDNGFYVSAEKAFKVLAAFRQLSAEAAKRREVKKRELEKGETEPKVETEPFRMIVEQAVERSEIMQRRFRHCAARALMILREYLGHKKNVGRMQVGSRILYNAVKRISNDFPILKEARREILEEVMDYKHAQQVITGMAEGKIALEEVAAGLPSPFAFGLIMEGYSDIIKIEDKQEFLKRMHQEVLAQIALKEGKRTIRESNRKPYNPLASSALYAQGPYPVEAETADANSSGRSDSPEAAEEDQEQEDGDEEGIGNR
jgi:ATP-dependent Lhr-like helicase